MFFKKKKINNNLNNSKPNEGFTSLETSMGTITVQPYADKTGDGKIMAQGINVLLNNDIVATLDVYAEAYGKEARLLVYSNAQHMEPDEIFSIKTR